MNPRDPVGDCGLASKIAQLDRPDDVIRAIVEERAGGGRQDFRLPQPPNRMLLFAVLVAAISVSWFGHAINRDLQLMVSQEQR